MPERLLGIDVGTTYCKAAVVDPDGTERAHGRVLTPWRRVPTGAEVEPERLAEAAVGAARRALERTPGARIIGVGVTSMAETGALLDPAGEPVAPAIAWHDQRGAGEAEALVRDVGGERFSATTGLPPSRLCTLVKYRWLRAHHSGSERGTRWLNVAEWVVRRLGGEEVADVSLASRTGMLALDRRAAWAEALDWAGARGDLVPTPVSSGTPAGRVSRRLMEARGAVLCVAGHDHLCASVGAGAVRNGDVFDSCGTAEAIVRAVSPLPVERRLRAVAGGVTVGWHAIPARQALLGAFEAGLLLARFGELLGAADERLRLRLDTDALAAAVAAQDIDLDDPASARRLSGSRGEVWRGVLEALAGRSATLLRTIEDVAGPTSRILVTGGGARSEAALAAKRSRLGPFERPRVHEAGARGAALLAGCAAGVFERVEELPPPAPIRMEAVS